MKRVLVKSVYDAFEYVMHHYYPFGLNEMVNRDDTYAVISIQDTHTKGFGFEFKENEYCEDVLTLYFDDIVKEVEGAKLFSEDDANKIIDFILVNRSVDTLLIHCYAGQSRSRAVGAFVLKMFNQDNTHYFEKYDPNRFIYDLLLNTYAKRVKL